MDRQCPRARFSPNIVPLQHPAQLANTSLRRALQNVNDRFLLFARCPANSCPTLRESERTGCERFVVARQLGAMHSSPYPRNDRELRATHRARWKIISAPLVVGEIGATSQNTSRSSSPAFQRLWGTCGGHGQNRTGPKNTLPRVADFQPQFAETK